MAVLDTPEVNGLVCPTCGSKFQAGSITVLGSHSNDFLVKCVCVCGVLSTFLVTTKIRLAPLSVDDVLIAHEFLEQYTGDMMGLFTER